MQFLPFSNSLVASKVLSEVGMSQIQVSFMPHTEADLSDCRVRLPNLVDIPPK